MNRKKITIINTVPINGGDEALLNATILGLKDFFDNPIISVLTNNPILYREYIDYVNLDWDWEYAFKQVDINECQLLFKIKKRIRLILDKKFKISYLKVFSRVFSSQREKRVYKILNDSDLIILGAGGYIHDFYGFDKRLKTLDFIENHLKKPYIFFSQSIGPFWNERNYPKLIHAFEKANKLILREKYSLNHLKSINYSCKNVVVTNDVAFYLYYKYAKRVNLKKKIKKIAINFREWNFEDGSKLNLSKAIILSKYLINAGFELSFISTCQGVRGYTDDSLFARQIIKSLNVQQQKSCTLFDDKYTLEDLLRLLSNQDAYIGMRLHGAILSLLAGIPALNIAYEDKTLGIFETSGLSEYCFSFKENETVWINKTENFIKCYFEYLNNIETITINAAESVKQNFKLLLT